MCGRWRPSPGPLTPPPAQENQGEKRGGLGARVAFPGPSPCQRDHHVTCDNTRCSEVRPGSPCPWSPGCCPSSLCTMDSTWGVPSGLHMSFPKFGPLRGREVQARAATGPIHPGSIKSEAVSGGRSRSTGDQGETPGRHKVPGQKQVRPRAQPCPEGLREPQSL